MTPAKKAAGARKAKKAPARKKAAAKKSTARKKTTARKAPAQRQRQPLDFVAVAPERAGAVAEAETGADGHAHHVGAVVAVIGDECHAVEAADPRQGSRVGQVRMGDDDFSGPVFAQAID